MSTSPADPKRTTNRQHTAGWQIGPNFPVHRHRGTSGYSGPRAKPPGAWSRAHERCVNCGRDDVPHAGLGLCRVCYGPSVRSRKARGGAQ